MTVSIIFHDDRGFITRLIVVDNDQVSTEVLSIDDFLRELASSSSLHKEDNTGARFLIIDVCLSFHRAKMLLLGNSYPAQQDFSIGNNSEIGKSVFDGLEESAYRAFGRVDLQGAEAGRDEGEDAHVFKYV